MQTPNRKRLSPMLLMFSLLAQVFSNRNPKEAPSKANGFAYHNAFMGGGIGEYHPRNHTIQTYRGQQRLALKRRRAR
jgi:hypothetical protein